MTMFNGIIYKYTSPSGKVYIGQTRNEKERRLKWNNPKGSYAGPKINRAREKYGIHNFTYEIIFRVECENEYDLITTLNQKEIEFIQQYDSVNNGYNLDPGGGTVMSNPETVKKASKSRSRAILVYDLNGDFVKEYDSSKDASIELGVSSGNISQVVKGARYQANGYIFKKKIDNDFPLVIDIDRTKIQQKRVSKYDLSNRLVAIFPSVTEAAIDAQVERRTFTDYLRKDHTYPLNDFIWKYTDEQSQ